MATVTLGPGLHIGCFAGGGWPNKLAASSGTIDAVGESVACIGRAQLTTGPGTSKDVSTASIIFRTSSGNTFADAGTTLRIGIQDVASGLEDGTFDVYTDWVGSGTPPITNNALLTAVMNSGAGKTIAHGDLIAVVFEMTARGGTDVVNMGCMTAANTGGTMPYVTTDTGAGPTRAQQQPQITIISNDGTIIHFGEFCLGGRDEQIAFHVDSSPDEYALLFQVPIAMTVSRLTAHLSDLDSGEDGELILYSAPLTTPVAERTVTVTALETGCPAGADSSLTDLALSSTFALAANTTYAIAYRPTTTGNRSLTRRHIGNATVRNAMWLGTTLRQGTRTGNTGAFSETTTILPALGFVASSIEDGLGGGGGGPLVGASALISA